MVNVVLRLLMGLIRDQGLRRANGISGNARSPNTPPCAARRAPLHTRDMKILVTGKGGREHTLVTALTESPGSHEFYSWPGSDAIFGLAQHTPVKSFDELVPWMVGAGIDLCVAGDENLLVTGDGLANLCARAGIPCWGPRKESAQLEASKEFAKEFLVRHGIPTAKYTAVANFEEAKAAAAQVPVVLKFDGLAAGKGVSVCTTPEMVEEFLEHGVRAAGLWRGAHGGGGMLHRAGAEYLLQHRGRAVSHPNASARL